MYCIHVVKLQLEYCTKKARQCLQVATAYKVVVKLEESNEELL